MPRSSIARCGWSGSWPCPLPGTLLPEARCSLLRDRRLVPRYSLPAASRAALRLRGGRLPLGAPSGGLWLPAKSDRYPPLALCRERMSGQEHDMGTERIPHRTALGSPAWSGSGPGSSPSACCTFRSGRRCSALFLWPYYLGVAFTPRGPPVAPSFLLRPPGPGDAIARGRRDTHTDGRPAVLPCSAAPLHRASARAAADRGGGTISGAPQPRRTRRQA